jgi:hypothetical protein
MRTPSRSAADDDRWALPVASDDETEPGPVQGRAPRLTWVDVVSSAELRARASMGGLSRLRLRRPKLAAAPIVSALTIGAVVVTAISLAAQPSGNTSPRPFTVDSPTGGPTPTAAESAPPGPTTLPSSGQLSLVLPPVLQTPTTASYGPKPDLVVTASLAAETHRPSASTTAARSSIPATASTSTVSVSTVATEPPASSPDSSTPSPSPTPTPTPSPSVSPTPTPSQ